MQLDLPRIIKELKLDVPVYRVQVHADCVELHLYGGKVATWKPKTNDWYPVSYDQEINIQDAPMQNCDKNNNKKGRIKK